MMNVRTLTTCAIGFMCLTHGVQGQDLARYRDFRLGSDLASVAKATGVAPSEAKTIHKRPAVLQELEWRPSRWVANSTAQSTDPVDRILFGFYDDQLFRIAIDYARDRTEGMTRADMIEAISAVYGTPQPKTARPPRPPSRLETESGSTIARWGDAGHSVVLYQTVSYSNAFRLIVTDVALDGLVRKAEMQALRLDDQEAPRREIERQRKERDDGRAAEAKARGVNKPAFRP
jgi:hypothetical protein